MSAFADSVADAVQRLSRRDSTLEVIYLTSKQQTDAELAELVDCLLAHPDVVKNVYLDNNQLTDETGVKLARYIAARSTIYSLSLSHNQFGSATYLALAAALRVNLSLEDLYLYGNQAVDRAHIVEALRLNPDRPAKSLWWLYSTSNDFERLRDLACELGHPSLQLLLAARLTSNSWHPLR